MTSECTGARKRYSILMWLAVWTLSAVIPCDVMARRLTTFAGSTSTVGLETATLAQSGDRSALAAAEILKESSVLEAFPARVAPTILPSWRAKRRIDSKQHGRRGTQTAPRSRP